MEKLKNRPLYIREKQLLGLFSISRKMVYDWKRQGLPYCKINRAVLFNLEDINSWIIANKSNDINKPVLDRKFTEMTGASEI